VPIVNLGGTERTRDDVIRRYFCLQCGYGWKTIEQFYDDLEIHGDKVLERLYDFMKMQIPRAERKNLPSLKEFCDDIRSKKINPKQTKLEL
jgi:hypothetical protein